MTQPPHDWLTALTALLQREPVVVRVVIAEARGSVPREPGAFMLVGAGVVEGTIGGGRLEWESIAAARELLDRSRAAVRLSTIVLAADVGQCCGGVVSVWLERFTREDLGFVRLARDAGARGSAVLSSTVRAGSVERRVVGGEEVIPAGSAGSDWDPAAAAARVAVGSGAVAEAGAAAKARVDVGSGAGVAPGVAAGPRTAMGAEVDALLRLPRLRARPRVLRATSGELTLLERLDDALPALWLYGAGHVGQALTRILTDLPLRLTWIDSRAELFPASVASGVRLRCDADSLATVAEAPAEAHFLVMTHSHALDYELVRAILRRNDFASLGLIGSQSKAARFRSRLSRDGIARDRIARLVCPIGVPGIESKWPAAIAVGVAAQVMQNISGATLEARYDGHRARDSGAPLSAGLGLARVSRAGLPRESGAGLPRARGVALPLVPEGQLAAGGHANSPLSAELTLDLPTVPPSAECAEGSCSTCGTHRQR